MYSRARDDMLCWDVQQEYAEYRRIGKSREEAVKTILGSYSEAMEDEEDAISIITGLILALCGKKELFQEIAGLARSLINQFPMDSREKARFEGLLEDPSKYGPEAVYLARRVYDPGWRDGDAFAHTITCPTAKALGIEGWSVILYKYGTFTDRFRRVKQLMCVSVCPPDQIPRSSQQLNELGFLPMMLHSFGPKGREIQYHVSVSVPNKREEANLALSKIGNFPDVRLPENLEGENLLVSRSFNGFVRKGTEWPFFEEEFCAAYRDYLRSGKSGN